MARRLRITCGALPKRFRYPNNRDFPNAILEYTRLYYTILYYTILYYTILYHTILYHTVLGAVCQIVEECSLNYPRDATPVVTINSKNRNPTALNPKTPGRAGWSFGVQLSNLLYECEVEYSLGYCCSIINRKKEPKSIPPTSSVKHSAKVTLSAPQGHGV